MKTLQLRRKFSLMAVLLCAAAMSAVVGRADMQNTVFSGSVSLNGDISDFFNSGGAPLPGVCVTNDPAGSISGVPNSAGLDENPLAPSVTQAGVRHPSAFNQRRIMMAYNPN